MTHIPLKRELLACPFCGCSMTVEPIARDWWRLSGDHDERCMLRSSETDVPQTAEQRATLISDWNRRSALYQPDTEQAEAVAWQWRERSPDPDDDNEWGGWRDVRSFDVEHIRRIVAARPDRREIRELYLHPPATPPSPSAAQPSGEVLTEEDIRDALEQVNFTYNPTKFARAIESALLAKIGGHHHG